MFMNTLNEKVRPDLFFTPEQLEFVKANKIEASVIGIDQSINSTGVTRVGLFSDPETGEFKLETQHYFFPPEMEQTRMNVICKPYEKSIHENRTNTELEHTRLLNFQQIAKRVLEEVQNTEYLVGVGVEGLSYNARSGKKNTSSNVYDLAALNAIIRDRVTLHLFEYNILKPVVTSIPPKSNKAKFLHGNADKDAMFMEFCRHYSDENFTEEHHIKPRITSTKKHGPKETYLFDIADSYAIARNEMHTYLATLMPAPEPKPKVPRKPRATKK